LSLSPPETIASQSGYWHWYNKQSLFRFHQLCMRVCVCVCVCVCLGLCNFNTLVISCTHHHNWYLIASSPQGTLVPLCSHIHTSTFDLYICAYAYWSIITTFCNNVMSGDFLHSEKSTVSWYEYSHSCHLLIISHMVYIFPCFYFLPTYTVLFQVIFIYNI
jgi:hypothetical protein